MVDVGGGYPDTELDGVSLGWKIGKLRPYELLPKYAQVLENSNGLSQDPRSGFIGFCFGTRNCHISGYLEAGKYPDRNLSAHVSVFERFEYWPLKTFDFEYLLF